MPGPVIAVSTARRRVWASALDQAVTDDGATIDVIGALLAVFPHNDFICLLTTAVKRINLPHCCSVTNAVIEAVARSCPYLTDLRVGLCNGLTDVSIRAVAENCVNLTTLYVCGCSKLTDASIVAVAESCADLTKLDVSHCPNLTDRSIGAIAENCPNLSSLVIVRCGLTALPENIGKLSKLRDLVAFQNRLEELPRSIVDLDASCNLRVGGNPLHTPPLDIATQGIPAIRRYFLTTSREASANGRTLSLRWLWTWLQATQSPDTQATNAPSSLGT